MGQRTKTILVFLCIFLFLGACAPPGDSDASDVDVPDTDPTHVDQASEPLSYEEFFSIERRFNYLEFEDGLEYSTRNWTLSHGHDEEVIYLAETINGKPQYKVVYDERAINEVHRNTTHLYAVADNRFLIRLDLEAKNEIEIYEADEGHIVESIRLNNDVLFFCDNNRVMRIYLPTGTIDEIYVRPDIPHGTLYTYGNDPRNNLYLSAFTRALSTTDIQFHRIIEPYLGDSHSSAPGTTCHAYSSLTNEVYDMDEELIGAGYEFFADQYLKERGDDLTAMGIDPYNISYRTPDDDKSDDIVYN